MPDQPVAVYVHTPFCLSKCGYCDFNSFAMHGSIVQRTVDAILVEIRRAPWRGRPAKTVFFGGGTPTFLSEKQLLSILDAVLEAHPPVPGAEITSEANPPVSFASVSVPRALSIPI
jgi:oxygen-independent coproporphyrinogen-3 oxidase